MNKNIGRMLLDKCKSQMAGDAIWTFSGQIAIMLCMLIINKILSNTYSIDEFGQYNIIRRSSSVLSFVMLGGIGIALPRYLPYYHQLNKFKTERNVILSSAIYILLISVIVLIGCALFRRQLTNIIIGEENTQLYYIVLFYSVGVTMCTILYAYYRGKLRFKEFNLSQIAFQLLMLIPVILLFTKSIPVLYLIWACISLLVSSLVFFYEIIKTKFILFKSIVVNEIRQTFKEIARYSIPRLLADFLLFSLNAYPLIYLGSNESLRMASFYSVGVTFITIVSPVFSVLGVILLPYVSKKMAGGKLGETNKTIKKLLLVYVVISFFAVFVLVSLMGYILPIFFSKEYLPAVSSSQILCLAIIPSAIYYLYRNPVDAASVFPYNTITLIFCAVTMIITFSVVDSLIGYSLAYLLVMIVKGSCTFLSWQIIVKKNINK